MKNILKRNVKDANKFAGKRQYQIRAGLSEKTLKRLKDLYELLQCDPDEHGYVVTTFKEMMELTEMSSVMLTTMIHNGLLVKAPTGGTPKFKYKWDTIKPTMDMSVTLINKKLELEKSKRPDDVISESKPEDKTDYTPGLRTPIPSMETNQEIIDDRNLSMITDKSIILESSVDDGIMTVNVNLEKLGITESAVLNAILAIDRA